MTLPASGTITGAQIRNELGIAAGSSFIVPTDVRVLTGVATGSIVWPNHFWGKSAVSQVATSGPTALGTSHSFPSVNFGVDQPHRTIVVLFFAMDRNTTWPGTVTISNINIGNAATANNVNFWFYQGSAPTTLVGVQTQSASPTGTSGNITCTTSQNTKMYIVVFSVASTVDFVTTTTDGAFSNGISLPVTLDTVPAGGVIIGGAIKQGGSGTPTMSFTNMTTVGTANPIGNYHLGWGFNTGMSAASGYVVTAKATGGESGGTQTGFATVVDALT
jgi:hypothetical protein